MCSIGSTRRRIDSNRASDTLVLPRQRPSARPRRLSPTPASASTLVRRAVSRETARRPRRSRRLPLAAPAVAAAEAVFLRQQARLRRDLPGVFVPLLLSIRHLDRAGDFFEGKGAN